MQVCVRPRLFTRIHPCRKSGPCSLRIQGLRCYVDLVAPRQNPKLLVDSEAPEELKISESFKYTSPLQILCEINGSVLAVIELYLDEVVTSLDS